MRILKLSIRNYRTLVELDLEFPKYYSAICGKNDSGKTNVVRAIRCLMEGEEDPWAFPITQSVSFKEDITKWVEKDSDDRTISISINFEIDPKKDTALYEYFVDYLSLVDLSEGQMLSLHVKSLHNSDKPAEVSVIVEGNKVEELKAREIVRRLRTDKTFLFHSSTDYHQRPFQRGLGGVFRDISYDYKTNLEKAQKSVNKTIKKVAKGQQQEIERLLGRLTEKHKVGVSCPSFNISHFPYELTLGDKTISVDLDDWGSGTQNRTLILLTIFRAKQIADSDISTSKVTPIIVIEEPESFLHPSAQAEFGRVLQGLAEEYKVQIITTTHSPYMLSLALPESNILLSRKRESKNQLRKTELIDTSGDKWMEPFAQALGLQDESFTPWREAFFSSSDSILLVEGSIDKEYFDLLCDDEHGANKLEFNGDIVPYSGYGALTSQTMLYVVKQINSKMFVTFDLDVKGKVTKTLEDIGLEKNKTYLPLGLDQPGLRDIEGLLPEIVREQVKSDNPALIDALGGTTDERKKAKDELKKLYLKEFKASSVPGEEYYGQFYKVIKVINRAFKKM